MTSISLLALLVVLGGLRLQLTNAAPGFSDRRQKLDMRDETSLSAGEKMRWIQEKLDQDGSVTFKSDGMVVQVTKDEALLEKRGPSSNSMYTFILKDPATNLTVDIKVKTFDEIMQILFPIFDFL